MNYIIHIIQHTARAATVLLLALLTAQTAGAQTPSGNWNDWVNDNNIDWNSADAKAAAIPQSDDGSTVYISTAEQLAYYAYAVNNDKMISGSGYYCGRTVELLADIDLSAHYWKPIGWNKNYYFNGYFHGNGHVITGMHVNGKPQSDGTNDYPCYGLFGYLNTRSGGTSIITDLVLKDFSVTASYSGNSYCEIYLGGLVGRCDNNTAITNCLLVNGSVSKSANDTYSHIGKVAGGGSPSTATANYYHNVSVSGWNGGMEHYSQQTIGGETEACAVALTISSTHGSVALGGTVGRISNGIIYAPANETVTLNTTADAGYIASLAATGLTLTSGQFTMPDNNDGTITATVYKLLIHDEITVTIPSQTYNGMPLTPAVTITDANEGSAKTLTEGEDFDIISGTCTNAGDYDISIQGRGNYKGERTEVFTIAKAAINPTLVIQDKTYNGEEITYTIENNPGGGQVTMFSWEKENSDNSWSSVSDTPKDAGKYRGTAVIAETDNYNGATTYTTEFTISKATPTVTAPTPIENLVYTGSAQALVSAGTTDFGTLLYSTDGENYSADIPTATDAGTYTVYYKVEGSDNWNAVDAQTVSVTIAPRTYTVTFDANGGEGTMEPMLLTYDGDWTALTANTFSRTGYAFKEWNTETDGSGTNYYDEEEVYNLTDEVNGNVVLYAQWGWDIATCDIRGTLEAYDDGYGPYNQLSANVEVWNGETQLTLDTDYTIELDPNVGTNDYVVGEQYQATIKGTGDWGGKKTFTFTVVALHHTVVFVANGGSGTMASDVVANDGGNAGRYYLPECTFTAPLGKVFDHWVASCEPDAEKQPGDYFTAPYIWNESNVQTITVTAYWRVILLDDDSAQPEGNKNADIIAANSGMTDLTVQLQGRTLYKDGSWNTLCLPFSVTTASGTLSGDNVKAMTLNTTTSNLTGSTLTLNFTAAETIPAGTPFIIKWDESGKDIENPVFENVKIANEVPADCSVNFTGGRFVGTYGPTPLAKDVKTNLYLGADNTLYYPTTEGFSVNAFRAYFQLTDPSTNVRAFVLNFGDGEPTLVSLPSGREEAGAWYTLDGRKLVGRPTQNGIYITNGKKVVIK